MAVLLSVNFFAMTCPNDFYSKAVTINAIDYAVVA